MGIFKAITKSHQAVVRLKGTVRRLLPSSEYKVLQDCSDKVQMAMDTLANKAATESQKLDAEKGLIDVLGVLAMLKEQS